MDPYLNRRKRIDLEDRPCEEKYFTPGGVESSKPYPWPIVEPDMTT